MIAAVRLVFLGCGFITRVHSRQVRVLGGDIVVSYASRDRARAENFRRRFHGETAHASYGAALEDPRIDAVVVAVPPRYHLDLTLQAVGADRGCMLVADSRTDRIEPRVVSHRPGVDVGERMPISSSSRRTGIRIGLICDHTRLVEMRSASQMAARSPTLVRRKMRTERLTCTLCSMRVVLM